MAASGFLLHDSHGEVAGSGCDIHHEKFVPAMTVPHPCARDATCSQSYDTSLASKHGQAWANCCLCLVDVVQVRFSLKKTT